MLACYALQTNGYCRSFYVEFESQKLHVAVGRLLVDGTLVDLPCSSPHSARQIAWWERGIVAILRIVGCGTALLPRRS
jgi:hypothetical protein